tara:strand:- start:570 stop:2918 length:2349 start_codon:yes stop_codon:yes gene_type:complete
MSTTKYTESYSPEIVKKLRNITHTSYEQMRAKYSDLITNKGEPTFIKTEVQSIRKLCREAAKSNFTRELSYKFAKDRTTGRLYSDGPSLQNILGFVRGALCGDRTYDIDMVNCHPALLMAMCSRDNIPHHCLRRYIEERESILKDVSETDDISRFTAKQLFLKSLNKETKTTKIGKFNIKNTFFKSFDEEMKRIIDSYVQKNPELYISIQQSQKTNHGGKLMAWLLNEAEGQTLNSAITCLEKQFIIRTLAFDGLMVSTLDRDDQPVDPNQLVTMLNQETADKSISWIVKPHDRSMVSDILDLTADPDDNIVIYGENEMDIVNSLFDIKFKNRFWRRNGEFYLRDNRVWITNKNHIVEIIRKAVRNTQGLVEHHDSKGGVTYENITQSLTKSKSVIIAIQEIVPENPTFIEDVEERCIRKLSFENGYLDFDKGKFIDYDSSNLDYDTINIINRDFEYIGPHDSRRTELIDKIFKPMFCVTGHDTPEYHLMEYFLHTQARALAGERGDKIYTSITGERDSCKSVYNDLLFGSFNSYVQMFNISTFELKRNDTEESRQLGDLLKHRHARLLTSQEVSEKWLNGILLKKVSSGGDPITARCLYKETETFIPEFKIMFAGNQNQRVKPVDALDKCFQLELKCKFVKTIPQHKSPLLTYYLQDDDIKKVFLKRNDIRNAMASLILDYYVRTDTYYPEDMKPQDFVNVDPNEIIKERFEITHQEKDKITNEGLKTVYDKLKDYFDSSSQLRKLLKHSGATEYNYKGRGLKGVKFIDLDDDSEEECDGI